MSDSTRYRFGSFELDPQTHELFHDGERVALQEHPLRILLTLVLRPGEIVSRDELVATLWPPGTYVDVEHGLNTAIRKLRRALGGSIREPALLETVPRRGYRLLVSVEELAPADRASVAVLPFADLSADKSYQHLSDGIAEELIHALDAIAGLRVAARSAAFRRRDQPPERAALEMGVRHVVAGTVSVEDGRCRIHCRLIEASSERELWLGRFERRLADLLVLERELAGEVVGSLVEHVLPRRAKMPALRPDTVSADAKELFLRARLAWRLRGHSIIRAISLLERAVALDAGYAPAWQALSAVLYSAAVGGHLPSMEAALRMAEAARRAVVLAPRAGATWLVEAMRQEWVANAPRKAAKAYSEAIRRSPRDTTAYGWQALFLASHGRFDEAIASARRGHAVDPAYSPAAAYLGWSYFFARRFDDALAVFDPTPDFAIAWISRAWIYELTGRLDDALAAIEAAVMSNETRIARRERARILARMGRLTEAQEAFDAVVESGQIFPSFERALYELAGGDTERARATLAVAAAEKNPWSRLSRVDPRLDALRSVSPPPRGRARRRASAKR